MAILKKEYELSVWDETLGEKGQKEEIKRAIIGAHDMSYLGRATSLKLSRKINGTNTLTFQLPSKYFDSELGEYVHNEFCDYLFNERKIKLKYDGEWFEFYVKSVSENKQFKSIMYQYSCEDAFIDELSRNGYGITFDTELYNNVEEIGIFTEQILEDSIWDYDASKNWGDFTEYSEEKLFKIPVSMFKNGVVKGYKINYLVDGTLTNCYTQEERQLEIGDDLAREKGYFWDGYNRTKSNKKYPLLTNTSQVVATDGYIYIPYSQLDFCYVADVAKNGNSYKAVEEPITDTIKGITSYCLAPSSIDPTSLIQFIAIPASAEVQIDEAGLLVNKDYNYVMTLKQWNEIVDTQVAYDIEKKKKISVFNNVTETANKIVLYDGYLESINDIELTFGKKISITDRTEINISENIDQYVKVYNNHWTEYRNSSEEEDLYTTEGDEKWYEANEGVPPDYRVCSYERTRTIVPQLARNLIQNGTEISDTSGWEVMSTLIDYGSKNSSIMINTPQSLETVNNEEAESVGGLAIFLDAAKLSGNEYIPSEDFEYFSILNFGITGQEEIIEKNQSYCFHIKFGENKTGISTEKGEVNKEEIIFIIGQGDYDSSGNYIIDKENRIEFKLGTLFKESAYTVFRSEKTIKNPYFCIQFPAECGTYCIIENISLFKAFTKGLDFFDAKDCRYKYSGRDIFVPKVSEDQLIGLKGIQRAMLVDKTYILLETDVVEGDTYGYQKYFIQQIRDKNRTRFADTFKMKSYLEENGVFDPTEYTEDEIEIGTHYIDLNKCRFYDTNAAKEQYDCGYGGKTDKICMYQKYGYCPYRFQTEKHCRKIRTLSGEKSNRFNLTQETSKVFEVYPVYWIEHEENGKIITDLYYKDNNEIVSDYIESDRETYERMRKKVFYITEKGMENKLGFRYEKNLSNISRSLDSKQIVTKLYVEDVDSELSKTGLCSIKTAEDNPSKDSFIIDFSYYILKGLLDKEKTENDLYGKNGSDMGYLKQLGHYNSEYDHYSNLIISLQDESYTELAANVEVNLTGIETAQQELNKIQKRMSAYSSKVNIDHPVYSIFLIDNEDKEKAIVTDASVAFNTEKSNYFEFNKGDNFIPVKVIVSLSYPLKAGSIVDLSMNFNGQTITPILEENGLEWSGDLSFDQPLETCDLTIKIQGQLEETAMVEESDSYKSYKVKYNEQREILLGLIESTFLAGDKTVIVDVKLDNGYISNDPIVNPSAQEFLTFLDTYGGIKKYKEEQLDTFIGSTSLSGEKENYLVSGMMRQYIEEFNQIKEWKKIRAGYLEKINEISLAFYQKYEPYLKEGTWSDSNYLSDNSYYFGAKEVAKEGAIPKVSYNISVVDLSIFDEDYVFNLADTTYVEDIETFGINSRTGMPNRLKVIISGITYDLDSPMQNSIEIQNYTSQFEDLFQQVTASVQSLSFNENVYKRSSNFTSTQNVSGESLQGGLSENQLTLLETDEDNLHFDHTGQSGSDINNHNNKYKLDGQGLFFSNNGGQSWSVGVTPKGINADYINVGTLDASKIQIVDGNYLYFLWDKSGINAYRTPIATGSTKIGFQDFARFNKYGLSLVEDGKIRLRAGYEYKYNGDANDEESGSIFKEKEIETDTDIGFYLYNSNGKVIFKTETASSGNAEEAGRETARLSLTGEIFVTDSRLEGESTGATVVTKYKYRLKNGYKINQLSNKSVYKEIDIEEKYKEILSGRSFIEERADETGVTDSVRSFIASEDMASPTITTVEYAVIDDSGVERLSYQGVQQWQFRITEEITSLVDGTVSTTTYYEKFLFRNGKSTEKELEYIGTKIIWVLVNSANVEDFLWRTSKQNLDQYNRSYYRPVAQQETDLESVVVYNINGESYPNFNYWEIYEDTGEISNDQSANTEIADEIGLFINNKISLENQEITTETEEVSKRIFSCIISTTGEVKTETEDEETQDKETENVETEINKRNILSILKNGHLLIGGIVRGPQKENLASVDMADIPDEIFIENPKIKMTQDGTVMMDFDSFLNMDEKSLTETINTAVGSVRLQSHKHDMNTWGINVEDNMDKRFYISLSLNLDNASNAEVFSYLTAVQAHINANWNAYAFLTDQEYNNEIRKLIKSWGLGPDIEEPMAATKRILIPVAGETYKVIGETGYTGGGSSYIEGGVQTAGYYLIDPLQV